MNWKIIGDVAFYAASVVTVLFAVLYLLFAPWWKNIAGRNIMAVMGSVALTFAYFSWAIAYGGIPAGFDATRAFLFFAVGAAIGWRTLIFIKHHVIRSLRKAPEEEDDYEVQR
jgi:hypothetical protein